MPNKEKEQIYKVAPGRIIGIFSVAFLVLEIIFYLTFQGSRNSTFWPLDRSFYFYTPALLIATFIFCYISITQTFYKIDGAVFVHSKMGKIVDYKFSNIVYVDEEFSTSKKIMRFFTKEGKEHLLMFDRKGAVYQAILEKSPLISKEEFERRFPNVKM